MSIPIQMIHIHYNGKYLNLLDSDDRSPLYRVKVWPHSPQMEMVRSSNETNPPNYTSGTPNPPAPICTAAFKTFSLQVKLRVHSHEVLLQREGTLTRTYNFTSSVFPHATLTWSADGALTGDYKLADEARGGGLIARFRNKVFSCQEVGSFELVGELDEAFRDEVVISGLAVLAMVQSLNLAGMVLLGGSPN